ncbi:hypothetical protein FRC02_011692 [Tulasnella sp. 418]|nr:hypothetical protein FRC02_011692 [Tulasnella sp. 418]
MPTKTLLIFCDATGQDGVYAGSDPNLQSGATVQYPSNVLRLSRAVAPKRGETLQITFYQSGVGSLADFAGESTIEDKKIALYGTAVASKIRDAYAFIAQNYEDGDEICLFGGAYTVRKVAGLINRIGLLGRKEFSKFFEYWQDLLDPKTQDNPPWPAKPIPIKCVGVFDTVGSVYSGVIPHPILDALSIKDTSIPPNVQVALHAVSLHENRKPFMCTLWTEPEGGLAKGQVLKQRYFPGAHSDVGGGFPNHELADVALFWIGAEISEFIELDLPFLAAWRQPTPEAPWGSHQPHNMWQENGSVPWTSATRLEGDKITPDAMFHPSVQVMPKKLENPKNMVTMEDLINKFGEGWTPTYAELLPFEKECAASWDHPQIPQQDVRGPKTANAFIHELAIGS